MLMGNCLVPRTRLNLASFQETLLKTSHLEHSLTWQGPQRSVIRRADVENICCTSLEMTVNKELVLCTQHSLDNRRALSICTLLVYGTWQLSTGFGTMVCFPSGTFLSLHLVIQHWACTGLSHRANTEELSVTIHRGWKEVTATTDFASIIFLCMGRRLSLFLHSPFSRSAFPKATVLDGRNWIWDRGNSWLHLLLGHNKITLSGFISASAGFTLLCYSGMIKRKDPFNKDICVYQEVQTFSRKVLDGEITITKSHLVLEKSWLLRKKKHLMQFFEAWKLVTAVMIWNCS